VKYHVKHALLHFIVNAKRDTELSKLHIAVDVIVEHAIGTAFRHMSLNACHVRFIVVTYLLLFLYSSRASYAFECSL